MSNEEIFITTAKKLKSAAIEYRVASIEFADMLRNMGKKEVNNLVHHNPKCHAAYKETIEYLDALNEAFGN